MSINKHHGGAIEGCYLVLNSAIDVAKSENQSYEDAASRIIDEFKASKKFIPGFGHRLHTADPRTARLKELAKESGYSGDCLRMAEIFERHFEKSGRSIPLNVDGALGAILGDLGVPHEMMNGFFMIARLPGLLTHVHEETTTMKPMRKIHPTDFNYTGPEERKV
jgi:citrate synthase